MKSVIVFFEIKKFEIYVINIWKTAIHINIDLKNRRQKSDNLCMQSKINNENNFNP